MKTAVQFRNITGFKHNRNFIENSIEQSLEKYQSRDDFESYLIVGVAKGRTETHPPIFECELLLIGNHLRRITVIKKTNSDFYKAIRISIRAAEKVLRRASKIALCERRHILRLTASAKNEIGGEVKP